jgi:hypothetical protein
MKYILGLLIAFGFVGVASATDCRQNVCQQNVVVQRQVVAHPQRFVEFVEVPHVQFIEVSHPQRIIVERQVVGHHGAAIVVEKQVVRQNVQVEKSVQRNGRFRSVQRSVRR